MEQFNIQTKRLLIRPLQISDLLNFHSYRSNPEVTKYQSFEVMTVEQAKEFIENNSTRHFGIPGEWVQYGMEHVNTKQLIGDCAIKLHQDDPRIAEIGMSVSHLEQKKGFAK